MSEDIIHAGNSDDLQIDVNDPKAIYQWTKTFGISEEALRKTIASVGPNIADVKKHLGYTDKPSSASFLDILGEGFGSLQL
jgi:hypothetical protein